MNNLEIDGPTTIKAKVTVSLCMSKEFIIDTVHFDKKGKEFILTGDSKEYLDDVLNKYILPTKDWNIDELEVVDYEIK